MEQSQNNTKKFYDETQYNYETSLIEDYLKQFLNHQVDFFKVDRVNSSKRNIYNESLAGEKKFLPKVELFCSYEIIEEESEYENGFNYRESLTLTVNILEKTLTSTGVRVDIGDFFRVYDGGTAGYRFFEITKKHDLNTATKLTRNFRPFFKTFKAVYVRQDVLDTEGLLDNLND